MQMEKTITIDMDNPTFDNMKHFGYKLCFAKKVGLTYNVVWKAKEESSSPPTSSGRRITLCLRACQRPLRLAWWSNPTPALSPWTWDNRLR